MGDLSRRDALGSRIQQERSNADLDRAEETVTVTGGADLGQWSQREWDLFGRREKRGRHRRRRLPPRRDSRPEPAVQVRSDFRSTILWQPDVVTGSDGTATVKVKYPDSLTGWQATARVNTAANQFGIASAATRTKQPLIVRLQAPRFFVVGDTVTVSAVINNNTEQPMRVAPALAAEGLTVTGLVVDGKAVKGEACARRCRGRGRAAR